MDNLTISIDKETAQALLEINRQYFFDLFKPICTHENDEYRYRDALEKVALAIEERSTQGN